jgi:hypothetical protein
MDPTEHNPPGNLTEYLQTEGRRRAAELAADARRSASEPVRHLRAGTYPQARPPQSLSEFLQAMKALPHAQQPAVRSKFTRTL